uniref:Uncharacterized protein n=1 Tax=Tetranychus urticae TaxID=32264 RepID=T1KZZ9_TETUR
MATSTLYDLRLNSTIANNSTTITVISFYYTSSICLTLEESKFANQFANDGQNQNDKLNCFQMLIIIKRIVSTSLIGKIDDFLMIGRLVNAVDNYYNFKGSTSDGCSSHFLYKSEKPFNPD